MDSVLHALKRARDDAGAGKPGSAVGRSHDAKSVTNRWHVPAIDMAIDIMTLARSRLSAKRIVSYDSSSKLTRPFDILRNTVLKSLEAIGSPVIAVTSPTRGCGVTTTATNLAFSIARLHQGNVLLVSLGSEPGALQATLGLDAGKNNANNIIWQDGIGAVEVGGVHLLVATPALTEFAMAGSRQAFENWIDAVKQQLGPVTIIIDLPPTLTDDGTAQLIAEADTVLLVLAVGKSTMTELEACKTYLHAAKSVQLVLNKARKYDL